MKALAGAAVLREWKERAGHSNIEKRGGEEDGADESRLMDGEGDENAGR